MICKCTDFQNISNYLMILSIGRYNFEKTSPLMCMIKFGPSHEGSPGCAIAAVYFGLMWNNVDNHSPPYADTVIGPNSQQWVGSQDEWLSYTLKEPIFDLEANDLQNAQVA
ncbi:hypothetical protein T4B_14033 [Trichinella pseudospiralis]|uniref:Uncharacterized protein n=2 Tax=Trichinella pseudospiralis TaxID=6337 RepID=A0A0V1J735_TRIPS|nr:hypothetical protein T4D_11409 [Trichinella pseudospiralis]KRZ22538.1 hypothetical protein T4B_14033 [Trichinella pseudospiralis]KRZ30751.1 hypothetical protein T4C_1764 [Trichinella pseudospiralis]